MFLDAGTQATDDGGAANPSRAETALDARHLVDQMLPESFDPGEQYII